jgi:hypothetical protein
MTTDDERAGHHGGREQVRLDRLAQQQAQHHRGREGDEHIDGEAPRLLAAPAQAHHGVAQPLRIDDHHREDRTGLDGNVEDLALLVGEAQQRPGQDEVAGAGDGQELGQALDDAHQGGLEQGESIHGEPCSWGTPSKTPREGRLARVIRSCKAMSCRSWRRRRDSNP